MPMLPFYKPILMVSMRGGESVNNAKIVQIRGEGAKLTTTTSLNTLDGRVVS